MNWSDVELDSCGTIVSRRTTEVVRVRVLTLAVTDVDVDGNVIRGELLVGGVGSSRTRSGTHDKHLS